MIRAWPVKLARVMIQQKDCFVFILVVSNLIDSLIDKKRRLGADKTDFDFLFPFSQGLVPNSVHR